MDSHRHLISLGFTSEKFPPGTHICYLYSDEDERRRVVSAFLNSGITEREAVHYFPDVLAADMLDHVLRQLDLAVPSEEPQQFDIVPAVEAYCPGGHFIPEGMLARLGGLYAQGIAAGFSGARMSGEMSWALRGIPGSERLVEYEARLNTLGPGNPLTIVCQYDTKQFDGATIFEVLNVHPMMIVRGQIMRNPYYIPHDEYLAAKSGHHGG